MLQINTMTVGQWLAAHHRIPVTVAPETSLGRVAELLLDTDGSRDAYVTEDDGLVTGHLSFGRVVNHLLLAHKPIHTRRQMFERVTGATAGELMDPHFVSATVEDELNDVLHRQLDRLIDDLVILDKQGRLLGSVNLRQVVRVKCQECHEML